MGRPNPAQRCFNASGEIPLSQRPQGVDHAGESRKAAEEDQPATLVVGDLLVVDQGALEFHQSTESRHVLRLSLDDVGKEYVSGLWLQLLRRNLFDPEDDRCLAKVDAHSCSGPDVFLVVDDTPGRGLDQHRQVLIVHQVPNEIRCQGCSSFPLAFCFISDCDHAGHGIPPGQIRTAQDSRVIRGMARRPGTRDLDTATDGRYGADMKKILFGLLFLGFLGLAQGCTSTFKAVDADPGFTFLRGSLSGVLASAQPKVETATVAAMEELDFVAVDIVSDKLKGTVNARMADGTKVSVKLQAEDFDSTMVKIKVGTWGDQSISVQILRHIQKKL